MYKYISLFGIIGVAFYFMHIIFGKMFYEGYNPLSQAISDLTAINSSSRKIASIFAFLYGIFSIIFSIGFFNYFYGKINIFITIGSLFFCIMTVISFLGYTLFPLSVISSEVRNSGTFQDKMHLFVTILVVATTIVSIILYSIGFMKTNDFKYLGFISIIAFLLLLIGATLVNILPKDYFGIAERINIYSIMIYSGIISIWMYTYIKRI